MTLGRLLDLCQHCRAAAELRQAADGMAAEMAGMQEQSADLERRQTAVGVAEAEARAFVEASSIAAEEREQALAARAEELCLQEAVLVRLAQLMLPQSTRG